MEKTEAKKYETRKKVFRLLLIMLLAILIIFIILIINKKIKDDKFYNEISKEIEYQVGNHVSGGVYANGYTYVFVYGRIFGHYDESGEWIQENNALYRIDKNGVCELFYSLNDNETLYSFLKPYIYYYDGWIYFLVVDSDRRTDKIMRISEDGTSVETLYETDGTIMFGIRDGYLIVSDDDGMYRIKLDDAHGFKDKESIDRFYVSDYLRHFFFGYWIYNSKVLDMHDNRRYDYKTDYSEYDESLRQYHDGNIYTLMQNEEYAGLDSYEHMDLVKRTFDESNTYKRREHILVSENKEEIIVSGVMCFNIFDDKLYYVTGSDGDNVVWRSDLDGENKEKLYQTDFEEKLYCKNMVVSDYNIICDFGMAYYDDDRMFRDTLDFDLPEYRIMKRCIINNETGNVNTIEF